MLSYVLSCVTLTLVASLFCTNVIFLQGPQGREGVEGEKGDTVSFLVTQKCSFTAYKFLFFRLKTFSNFIFQISKI